MNNWKLDDSWEGTKRIIVFGFGRLGKKILKKLKEDFEIVAIIENDKKKCNTKIEEIPVIHFDEAINLLNVNKTVIAVQEHYYIEIKSQLEAINLKENIDFSKVDLFITEWYYKYKNRSVCMTMADLYVTPFCTLRCEKCITFHPYWKDKREPKVDELTETIDAFFNVVDYVFTMKLFGGEALLYRKLDKIIEYIGKKYNSKIGYFAIITNGTIIPEKKILELLKKYNVYVSISDYSDEVNYKNKIDKLCDELEKYGIEYLRNRNIEWFDFGFPHDTFRYSDDDVKKHHKCCNNLYHVICDKKLFYCNVQFGAYKGGLFPLYENDYIDLQDAKKNDFEFKRKLMSFSLGEIDKGYLEFCKVCGGYGIDNNNKVITAKQLK